MSFHVPNRYRITNGQFASIDLDGNNGGMMRFTWSISKWLRALRIKRLRAQRYALVLDACAEQKYQQREAPNGR